MKQKALLLGLLGGMCAPAMVQAQMQPITSIGAYYETAQTGNVSYTVNGNMPHFFGTTSGTNQNDLILQNYTAGGHNYVASSLIPSTVKFRRVDNANATGDKVILFFEINEAMYTAPVHSSYIASNNKYLKSSYMDAMELAFAGRTLNRGSDNIMGNQGNGQGNNNNVERIDVVFDAPRPILAGNGNGITMFERGTPSNHGGLKIALILSVDASGNPTSYSNIYTVSNSGWSATDVIPNKAYGILNSTAWGASVPAPYKIGSIDAVTQSIGGIFIPFVGSFGLSATATPTVYGYSIMAGDVTATTSAEILDYTNSTLFPTNTDGNDNTIGGMDLIAVTMDFEDAILNPIDLSGNVFDDGNGASDNTINGTNINSVSGQQLYVNLIDVTNGNIIASVPVAANGSWSIPNVARNSNYTLSIGTAQGTVGMPNPGNPLPADWKNTAEWTGTAIPATPTDPMGNGFYGITVGTSDVTDINFALDRIPVANAQSYTLDLPPTMNMVLILNGTGAANSPAALSGTDPEDGTKGSGSTFNITTIPAYHQLWYNGVQITGPISIPNYNPALLEVHFTSVGTQPLSFNYTVTDNAGVVSAAKQYIITFPGALPVVLSAFDATLQGKNVQLKWESTLEQNVSRYVVEHSLDGNLYEALGSVLAKGNSVDKNGYQYLHTGISSGTHYYRLRMEDMDGSYDLSAVRMIRYGKETGIRVSPNPVSHSLQVSGISSGDHIRIADLSGRIVYAADAQANTAVISCAALPAGLYLVQVTGQSGEMKYNTKIIKQ